MRISDWSSDVCSSDLQVRQTFAAEGPSRLASADVNRGSQSAPAAQRVASHGRQTIEVATAPLIFQALDRDLAVLQGLILRCKRQHDPISKAPAFRDRKSAG